MLGVSSIFSKRKARSAPCSPATINNNNGVVKRLRSPGSLSPLPSPFYDDEIKRYVQNHHSNSPYCPHEVPDFTFERRSSKRHRIEPPPILPPNDSVAPVKISSSPPNTSHNMISPRISPSCHDQQQCCSQPQFPFPQILTSDDQPPPTLQPPQQPYYPQVSPPPSQQSRQPSPKQQDYPSPNHSSQFLKRNIASNHHMVQPQQPPPSSQSPAVVVPPTNQSQQRFTQFVPRRNNVNSGNNNNNNNSSNNNNNNNVQGTKKCESCHTSSSPEWRRGPTGHKTLCNACGLRYSRTIARENRKREQAQREQEQRQREEREREERARERAAATVMMQRAIEPFPQYRPSNVMMTPGQQQHHHHHPQTPSGPPQYHSSTLPPLNYHLNNQSQLPQPQTTNHHHLHNQHHVHHHSQPPLNERGRYTLPSPHLFDRQQNGTGNIVNNGGYNPVVTDNHRRDQPQHNGESERYNTNMMNNIPPTANAYPKEAYFGRAQ